MSENGTLAVRISDTGGGGEKVLEMAMFKLKNKKIEKTKNRPPLKLLRRNAFKPPNF